MSGMAGSGLGESQWGTTVVMSAMNYPFSGVMGVGWRRLLESATESENVDEA